MTTGHPVLFNMHPVFELGAIPEGGGYPVGMFAIACALLEVPSGREGEILHLCSGSVRAPRTVDVRRGLRPTVCADVRWLPFRPGSIDWIMADPPYGQDYAQELWGLGKVYPTPTVLLEECAEVLRPGGQVAFFHQVVPRLPACLERKGTYGISTGPGYRLRALTIAVRTLEDAHLVGHG